jgi:hypothetical protein
MPWRVQTMHERPKFAGGLLQGEAVRPPLDPSNRARKVSTHVVC